MQKTLLILLTGLITACLGCKSDKEIPVITYLFVQVVDEVNNAPLADVNYTIQLFNTTSGTYSTIYESTKADGMIKLEFFGEFKLDYLNCEREGYVGKYGATIPYTPGDSNIVETRMSRYDGVIRLEVENTSAAPDSLYFTLRSGVVIRESANYNDQFKGDYPIIIQPGEQKTYHIITVAEDAVSLYWSWDNMESIALIPFRNVVIPPRGDTLVYKVTN